MTINPFSAILKVQKRKGEIQMRHYLFEDEATGEEFIVGEYCIEKAYG